MHLLDLKVVESVRQYEWMTCDSTSFLTVFQTQDNGWVLMKYCVQWNPVYN